MKNIIFVDENTSSQMLSQNYHWVILYLYHNMGTNIPNCAQVCNNDQHTEMVSGTGYFEFGKPLSSKESNKEELNQQQQQETAFKFFKENTLCGEPSLSKSEENSAQVIVPLKIEDLQKGIFTMSSGIKENEIMIDQNQLKTVADDIDENVTYAPFQVIQLTLRDSLKLNIDKYGRQLMAKFKLSQGSHNFKWTLNSLGYYVSLISETHLCIFTDQMYFQGEVIKNQNGNFVPNNNGVMINEEGIYKGRFQGGLADGKGSFLHGFTKTLYRGQWKKGLLHQGVIENSEFKYTGKFLKGFGNGQGKMLFKLSKAEYTGTFKNGLFDGKNCKYDCGDYTYEGDFEMGQKSGFGTVKERQKKIIEQSGKKGKRKRYRPPVEYYGEWKSDNLIEIIQQSQMGD